MIRNKSNNKILAKSTKNYKNLFLKAKGLMFTQSKKDFSLVFEFKSEQIIDLTMLFVFYPIDILWLDKSKRVVQIKENAMPFSFLVKAKKKAKYVIELPRYTIKKSKTKIKDKIMF